MSFPIEDGLLVATDRSYKRRHLKIIDRVGTCSPTKHRFQDPIETTDSLSVTIQQTSVHRHLTTTQASKRRAKSLVFFLVMSTRHVSSFSQIRL